MDLLYDDILLNLREKRIVLTDVFNVFEKPDNPLPIFNNFNFIIESNDIISNVILKSFFKNINQMSNTSPKIYVNPHSVYSNTASLYIKPPSPKILLNESLDIIRLFEYQYKILHIIDNDNIIHGVLNIDTIDIIDSNKIWQYNPSFTNIQNTDILMQKLIGDDIRITSETYNNLVGEITQYTQFKPFTIKKQQASAIECSQIENSYNIYGFNLTNWP